jgi:polar amino acid transport system substrate-binding protein
MTEDATPTPCVAPRSARPIPTGALAGLLGRALALSCLALIGATAPAAAQTVRAVTEATTYTYLRDGKVSGRATQLVETALRNAGLDHQINLYPWARAYDMAAKEPNVLIFLIARTPAREPLFRPACERYAVRALVLGMLPAATAGR